MIMVTGATGLVGGHLIWYLLQKHHTIVALKRTSSNTDNLLKTFGFYTNNPKEYINRIVWRTANLNNIVSINIALEGITYLYHCAAEVTLSGSNDNLHQVNVMGTKNLLEAAKYNKVKKVCFVSSIAACGKGMNNELITENAPWDKQTPRTAYSLTKYLSEQEVWQSINDGLNAIIVNPGVILGYSGSNSGSSKLFAQVKKGLPFYTNGGSGYVDVEDVVKIMILLVKSNVNNQRYIITAENCSNRDILNWMADGFEKKRPFICIGKHLFQSIGFLSEFAGKLFHFQPTFDTNMARTATKRAYYSNLKVKNELNYTFNSIEKCIIGVCKHLTLNS